MLISQVLCQHWPGYIQQLPLALSCHGGKLDRYIQGNKHGGGHQWRGPWSPQPPKGPLEKKKREGHPWKLGSGFKYVLYVQTSIWGRWSNLTIIFEMGWNHQLVILGVFYIILSHRNSSFHVPFCRQDHPWFHGTRWWYHPWQWTRWRQLSIWCL